MGLACHGSPAFDRLGSFQYVSVLVQIRRPVQRHLRAFDFLFIVSGFYFINREMDRVVLNKEHSIFICLDRCRVFPAAFCRTDSTILINHKGHV